MWPNLQETADLVTFTEEILNGKFHFLCSEKEEHIECNASLAITGTTRETFKEKFYKELGLESLQHRQ